jgi:hypothetical protein
MIRAAAARRLSASAIVAMVAAFVAFASTVGDPALARGVFAVGDRRVHRLGSLPHAEAAARIAQMRAERDAATDPQQKALMSVRLSDALAARQMFAEARAALEDARTWAPAEPTIRIREALVDHAMGDGRAAAAALDEAERLAPGDPEVSRARAFIEADRSPATDRWRE